MISRKCVLEENLYLGILNLSTLFFVFCFADDFDILFLIVAANVISEKQVIFQICLCALQKIIKLKQFICIKWKTVVNLGVTAPGYWTS